MVGVAGDIKQTALEDPSIPTIYVAVSAGAGVVAHSRSDICRADPRRSPLVPLVREQINAVDPQLPLGRVSTINALMADSLAALRFRAVLLGTFAIASALLIGVGILGVLTSFAAQRTREIGVRMTLGARSVSAVGLVLSQALGMVGIGLIGGFALAIPLTPLLRVPLRR